MKRIQTTLIAVALAACGSAALAQDSGGSTQVTSTTRADDNGFPWDLLGLLGLAGLLGLRRRDDHVVAGNVRR